jgi:hypothetical protein
MTQLAQKVVVCSLAAALLWCGSAVGAVLLQQTKVPTGDWTVMMDINFEPANDANDVFLADDFTVPIGHRWQIRQIAFFGAGWGDFTSLEAATDIQCFLFPDRGGVPSGVPLYDDSSKLWSETWTPGDGNIAFNEDVGALVVDFMATPVGELELTEGSYWLSCFVSGTAATFGLWGVYDSPDDTGTHAVMINPGGGMSLPIAWTDISVTWSLSYYGLAFELDGEDVALDDDDDSDDDDDDSDDDSDDDNGAGDDDDEDDDADDDAADEYSGGGDDDDSSGCGC